MHRRPGVRRQSNVPGLPLTYTLSIAERPVAVFLDRSNAVLTDLRAVRQMPYQTETWLPTRLDQAGGPAAISHPGTSVQLAAGAAKVAQSRCVLAGTAAAADRQHKSPPRVAPGSWYTAASAWRSPNRGRWYTSPPFLVHQPAAINTRRSPRRCPVVSQGDRLYSPAPRALLREGRSALPPPSRKARPG
jgi:hypothetical protein